MSISAKPISQKVRAHRAAKRAAGWRLVQFWAPDMRSQVFIAEAHRQAQRVAASEAEADDQRFIDTVSDLPFA